jgi:hypothetical protein
MGAYKRLIDGQLEDGEAAIDVVSASEMGEEGLAEFSQLKVINAAL